WGKYEQQRRRILEFQLKYDPSYRAVQYLSRTDSDITPEEYYRALSSAYTAIRHDHFNQLREYAETPWYDRGIVHSFRLMMASLHMPDHVAGTAGVGTPLFQDEDSVGFGGDLARFMKYQKEVDDLSDALWTLANVQSNRSTTLTEDQKAVLIRHGFIKIKADGSQERVVPWQAEILHRDLDLPHPTVIDQVLNPKNIAILVVTVVLPAGAAVGTSRMLVSLEGLVGGLIVRTAFEAALFTVYSFPMQHWLAPDDHKPNIFGTFTESFAMFAVLGVVGKAGGLFPEAKLLFAESEAFKHVLLRGLYKSAGMSLRLTTEASIMSGLEVLSTGQDFSGRMFLRHLLTVGMLHAGSHAALRGAPRAVNALRAFRQPVEPAGVRPAVDPALDTAVNARHRNAEQLLSETGRLEETFATSGDRAAVKTAVEEAGALLVEVTDLPQGVRAQVRARPDGGYSIHFNSKSLRVDILNELGKLKRLQKFEISGRTGLSQHELALIEYESYVAEAELYRDLPMSDRKASALGLKEFWANRLKELESGKVLNKPVARPLEGFTLDIGKLRFDTEPIFNGYLRMLDIPGDFAAGSRLKELASSARDFVLREQKRAQSRITEFYDTLLKMEKNYETIERWKDSTEPDAPGKVKRA
ncbi:MAG: hypothetical protein KAI25_14210, partial [Hyphomicrobiaceae bacterium]|nr:hypothetical protein [Hyphomicrobiaceae bacterium]